jgi:hypothetical protein
MDLQKIAGLYARHTEKLITMLDELSDTQLAQRPAEDQWSAAQVADHICATTEKCLGNALQCAKNEGERGHSGFGPAVFSWMGAFPPVKIKVKVPPPGLERLYQPNPISRTEAVTRLRQQVTNVNDAVPILEHADLSVRLPHWAGGWFNAHQWLHSAEMHIKHHFRQLSRIEKQLHRISR